MDLGDLPDFDEHDERENRNKFATYDDVNRRQAKELRDLLGRWQSGATPPWEVMSELAHTVGVRASFLISYDVGKKYGPGTQSFEAVIADVPNRVQTRQDDIGRESERAAAGTLEWIERLKEIRKTPNPEIAASHKGVLDEQRADIAKRLKQTPEQAKPLKINDDIQGPQGYVQGLQSLIRARDQAAAEGNELFQAICENAIGRLRVEKKEADYDAAHVDKAVERARKAGLKKREQEIAFIKSCFRPEVLNPRHAATINKNIQEIRISLDLEDFDSWDAARAMAEVLLRPIPRRYNPPPTAPIKDFLKSLAREKEDAEARRKSPEKTLGFFQPVTEDEIKAPLARRYAKDRAYKAWKAKEIERYKATHKGEEPPKYHSFWGFEFNPGENEKIPFKPPIDYPGRPLCHEIHIEPSGTGLIEIYPKSDDLGIYGEPVARITTYSVSFVPKNPADLKLLQETLKKALEVLGDIEHRYSLPGWTPSGKSYMRVKGSDEGYRDGDTVASSYIDTKNGKVTPSARFDLDDLWLLYFLMEPVIEPSAQIAAAMNAARYAEERGAILKPNEVDYVGAGHEVADRHGFLKDKKNEPDLLAAAARDALVMRALNKTDNAGLTMTMAGLATQTLTGRMPDPHGLFPTFDRMLADGAKGRGGAVITFEEALVARTKELMGRLVGLPEGSEQDLARALAVVLSKISGPLQEEHRARHKRHRISIRRAIDQKLRDFQRRSAAGWDPFADIKKEFDERDLAVMVSDLFSRKKIRTEEEVNKPHEKALTAANSLVIRDSEVETALDGIHGNGRYMTRMKGSPLVRYELPKALQRFNPGGRHQPARPMIEHLQFG